MSNPVEKEELVRVAITSCENELTEHVIYSRLAASYASKKPDFAKALNNLAAAEKRHYELWKKFADGKATTKPNDGRIRLIKFLRTILGTTFAVKFLEKGERKTIAKYKSIRHLIPAEDEPAFDAMLQDEVEHEVMFANQLQSAAIKYISFIILGLADAIVEISGIHAGSLGLYKSTEITGLAGIVAGAAASIAMASAAFAQAKQGFQGKPSISAVFTGVSYFVTAVALALPYFLTGDKVVALLSSVVVAVLIVAFIDYYNSVVSGTSFLRDFGELAGIMLGATVALYLFGTVVGSLLGIATPP
ncbi:MAG: rubrerythrin family protein [Thaumarchaeota archaeon]|nr:rubrerythrin family protein [Nitrososphaerota archaeon]